jgi:hypothetical protein
MNEDMNTDESYQYYQEAEKLIATHKIHKDTAINAAQELGYRAICMLIKQILQENRQRSSPIGVAAAFRQRVRTALRSHRETMKNEKDFIEFRETREEVKKMHEAGWRPDEDTLIKCIAPEQSQDEQAYQTALRFVISLRTVRRKTA